MSKPNWLKSKREKRSDLIFSMFGLAIAVRDYKDRKEKEQLEIERLQLENDLLKKQLEKKPLILTG